jgi:hypothetical protein
MDFVPGTTYENASGSFLVVSVGATTTKLQYSTGPQAGRVLTKRTADLARLATREAPVQPAPAASAPPPVARTRHRP